MMKFYYALKRLLSLQNMKSYEIWQIHNEFNEIL